MARATSTTNNAEAGVPSAPDATGALTSFDSKNYRERGSNPHGPRARGILSPLSFHTWRHPTTGDHKGSEH